MESVTYSFKRDGDEVTWTKTENGETTVRREWDPLPGHRETQFEQSLRGTLRIVAEETRSEMPARQPLITVTAGPAVEATPLPPRMTVVQVDRPFDSYRKTVQHGPAYSPGEAAAFLFGGLVLVSILTVWVVKTLRAQ